MTMLNELEEIFARCGALVFGLGISLLVLSSAVSQIQRRFAMAVVGLGAMFIFASFAMFRGNVYGYQKHIDRIAEQPINSSRFNGFIGLCWVFLIALPIGVLGLKLAGIADGANFYDFGAYYNAGERVINGYPLYDWTTPYSGVTDLPESPDRYLYAPLISLLFVPFSYLPYETSVLAWTVLSVSVYLMGITVFLRSLPPNLSAGHWLMIWTGALGFGPFVVGFIAGQVTAIVTGLLALTATGIYDKNRTASLNGGAILAIPVMIKAYYAPVGAPLLRKKRRLVVAISTVVILMVGGLLVFGVSTTLSYFEVLVEGKGWGEATDPPVVWNINDFHPFYYFGDVGYVIRAVILSAIAAISYRSRQYNFEYVDLYVLSLGILGLVLGSPTLATPGIVVTVPVILFLLVTTYRDRPVVFGSVLVATLLIHAHPYTNELITSIILPTVGLEELGAAVIPVIQPAVWGVTLLLVCVAYEYTRRRDCRES